jgi:hypothetical protein
MTVMTETPEKYAKSTLYVNSLLFGDSWWWDEVNHG